jgi:cytochrome c oxidase cbb3-type subunit 3
MIMSDFISEFWNVYVVVIVLASVLGCAVLLWYQGKHKATVGANGEVGTSGHVWDDIQEYNHPLPKWWSWMFYITVFFGLAYFVLYPGLGRFQGLLGWSSVGQYQAERERVDAQVAPIYARFMNMDVRAVAADKEAREMGRRLFLTYCSQCHGSDAKGAKGFPNLADGEWQWGGEPEQIHASIAQGRVGVMPPFAHLGDAAIADLASYVRALAGYPHDAAAAQRGGESFVGAGCVACHGMDGTGNPLLGAPNLTDKVWLYGSGEAEIIKGIKLGRQNKMPAWQDFLGDAKVHVLTAYVYGLSKTQ